MATEEIEKVLKYTESLFEKYGAVKTNFNIKKRMQFHERAIYIYKGEYYRLDAIQFNKKPFIVFEWIDDENLAKVGVMEDGDSFPYDLPCEKIEKEVRFLFEIEPYPPNYPDY